MTNNYNAKRFGHECRPFTWRDFIGAEDAMHSTHCNNSVAEFATLLHCNITVNSFGTVTSDSAWFSGVHVGNNLTWNWIKYIFTVCG